MQYHGFLFVTGQPQTDAELRAAIAAREAARKAAWRTLNAADRARRSAVRDWHGDNRR